MIDGKFVSVRISLGRSLTMMSSNSGNIRNLRLLLLRHKLLLLLQPLHHRGQYLDLLYQGGKQVLLAHRWWGWWSERLQHLARRLFMACKASSAASRGILVTHLHHRAPDSSIFFLLLPYLAHQFVTVKSPSTRTLAVPKDLSIFFGGMRCCSKHLSGRDLQEHSLDRW